MINSNSADLLKSKPMPKSTEVKGKSQIKNTPSIDKVRNGANSLFQSTIIENEILKNNNIFRNEIEDKIKSAKQEVNDNIDKTKNDVFKWVGIISIVITISFVVVTAVLTYLVKSYTEEIKLIPVHEDRIKNLKEDINNLEKNFEKFFKNKKF